jgi:hypothetical protein
MRRTGLKRTFNALELKTSPGLPGAQGAAAVDAFGSRLTTKTLFLVRGRKLSNAACPT